MDQPPKPLPIIEAMDHPSIIKLLEDVDESMQSGADVEALVAALNPYVGGDSSTFSKPSDPHSEQPSSEIAKLETKDQDQKAEMEVVKTVEINQAKASDKTSSQLPKQENSQQVKPEPQDSSVNKTNGAKRNKTAAASSSSSPSIFQLLIPVLHPHLDDDRSLQLVSLFYSLRNKEVTSEECLIALRNIVGDQRLRQAVVSIVHNQHKIVKEEDEENKKAFDLAVKEEITSLKQVVDDLRMQLAKELDDLRMQS